MEKIVGYTKKRIITKTHFGTITTEEDVPVKEMLTDEDFYYGTNLGYFPLKKLVKNKDGFYEGLVEIEFDIIKCKKVETIKFNQKHIDKELEIYIKGKLSPKKGQVEVLCDISNLKYTEERIEDHGEEYQVSNNVSNGLVKVLAPKRKLKDYPVYFIRHNFAEKEINDFLLKEDLIAIHFNEEFSLDWNDYSQKSKKDKGFIRAWKCLENISYSGAFIIAEYKSEFCLIGFIPPNSKIEPKNITINGKVSKGYKTLKLLNSRKIKYSEFPVLTIKKPPFGTLIPIKADRKFIIDLFFQKEIEISLSRMHYKAQELMCYEWLKSKYCPEELKIDFLLLSIGRKLQGTDILAKTKNGKILSAQVTYYSDDQDQLKTKKEKLMKFSPENSFKILFARHKKDIRGNSTIWEISLDKVWKDFEHDKKYRKFLEFSIKGNVKCL